MGGPYVLIGTSFQTDFSDTGVINGNTYYYLVSAYNGVYESPYSIEIFETLISDSEEIYQGSVSLTPSLKEAVLTL